jgi:membrane fusion protein, heavy metal efflux system
MDAVNVVKPASRPRRAARGAGAVLVLGLAAGAIYYLPRDSTEKREAGRPEPGQTEPAGNTPDGAKDPSTQVVKLSPESVRKYGIRIGTVRKRKLVSEIVAPARVAFNSEATAVIGTPVQGRVIEVMVRAGDRVDQGAALLELESTELGEAQTDYIQRQTAVRTAQGAIRPLTEIFERIKKLHDESKLIGITDVQERELELKKAEGALANAQAAVTAAANKLHLLGMNDEAIYALLKSGKVTPRYVVRTPLSGEVIERSVNLGELVKPEREKLFVVADTSVFWVWADVPEARVPEVASGAAAEIVLATGVEQKFSGVISHLAPSIDPETRSLRVRIDVKSDPALRPGMFAEVRLSGKPAGDTAEAMLIVPQSAIQTVEGGTAVFMPVQGELNSFQARKVSLGACADGFACVISGLGEGERIITAGGPILKADLLKGSAKDED